MQRSWGAVHLVGHRPTALWEGPATLRSGPEGGEERRWEEGKEGGWKREEGTAVSEGPFVPQAPRQDAR